MKQWLLLLLRTRDVEGSYPEPLKKIIQLKQATNATFNILLNQSFIKLVILPSVVYRVDETSLMKITFTVKYNSQCEI